ncbi:MAG: geranyl transferase, partial [Candidatus Zixiibacteriota bacterium]
MNNRETSFSKAMAATARRVRIALETCLPSEHGEPGEAELAAAMRYAVLGGGKR